MKALTLKQPWAHVIVKNGKRIENRTWKTKYRGPLLIHAGKGWDQEGYEWILDNFMDPKLPAFRNTYPRGGIVAVADLVDCVTEHTSPWFAGPYGFVLENVQPVEFFPRRGMQGFFNVDVAMKNLKKANLIKIVPGKIRKYEIVEGADY